MAKQKRHSAVANISKTFCKNSESSNVMSLKLTKKITYFECTVKISAAYLGCKCYFDVQSQETRKKSH